jgi:hypothetical protein
MTGKADFTAEEWETVLHGPPTAGLIVITAQRGGTFRETFAMTQSYIEARKEHGQSQLLDEIVSARPALDRTRYHSPEELKKAGLDHLRAAVGVLEQKATPDEVASYKKFVTDLAGHVAHAHREGGVEVSADEQAALTEIAEALHTSSP